MECWICTPSIHDRSASWSGIIWWNAGRAGSFKFVSFTAKARDNSASGCMRFWPSIQMSPPMAWTIPNTAAGAQRLSISPKIPRLLADNPTAQEEVRNGVGGYGVAEPVFANYKGLVNKAAKKTSDPLIVNQTEEQ